MPSRFLKSSAAVLIGFAIYLSIFGRGYVQAVTLKVTGEGADCPWNKIVSMPSDAENFRIVREALEKKVTVLETDAAFDIQRIETPYRSFWIKREGADMDGSRLVAYLLSEQDWLAQTKPLVSVHKGDWVIDVGAHVGTFTDRALRLGAEKVFMIEPDPVNIECIRRNFAAELASGRVVLIPEGAWSSVGKFDLNVGVANSGTGSMMYKEQGSRTVSVPVRPIDQMLAEYNAPHIDFIKMDIEGAEREALKGAAQILKRWKPRLALDDYHLADDAQVLPTVILAANPEYKILCGPCELNTNHGNRLSPHVVFYQ